MATASSTSKLYKTVVEDVINNVKEAFLDEGVDEQVLQELKQLWETKLTASKALEPAQNESDLILTGGPPQLTVFQPQHHMLAGGVQQTYPGLPVQFTRAGTELSGAAATATMALPRGIFQQQMAQLNAGGQSITLANGQLITVPQLGQQRDQAGTTSITIPQHATLLPGQLHPGITMQQIRQATISGQIRTVNPNMVQPQQLHGMRQVPSTQSSQNKRMAHPHQNSHTQLAQHHMSDHGQPPSLQQSHHQPPVQQQPPIHQHPPQHSHHHQHQPPPHSLNHPYLQHQTHQSQQHLLAPHQQRMPPAQQALLQTNTSISQQMYGMPPRPRNTNPTLQLDGAADTSSSSDDDLDNDDDDDENDNENDNDEEAGGEEEEPLNTDDDISEEDPNDLFDTDNVIVCQYDKINRNKNKWKFHLKDGIMNLKGKDYVFQKANGEAEW